MQEDRQVGYCERQPGESKIEGEAEGEEKEIGEIELGQRGQRGEKRGRRQCQNVNAHGGRKRRMDDGDTPRRRRRRLRLICHCQRRQRGVMGRRSRSDKPGVGKEKVRGWGGVGGRERGDEGEPGLLRFCHLQYLWD